MKDVFLLLLFNGLAVKMLSVLQPAVSFVQNHYERQRNIHMTSEVCLKCKMRKLC